MSKKDVVSNVKKYSFFNIIWWISLIPTIISFVLLATNNKNEGLKNLETLLLSFGSIFAILSITGFVGKTIYWIKILQSTLSLKTENKNILVTLMILDIFIPFIPFYIYRKKVDNF